MAATAQGRVSFVGDLVVLPAATTDDPSTAIPQRWQKRAPAERLALQAEHLAAANAKPQDAQKAPCAAAPQRGHFLGSVGVESG
jgi:hypothetical protein